jgi:hypothetical protein
LIVRDSSRLFRIISPMSIVVIKPSLLYFTAEIFSDKGFNNPKRAPGSILT